MVADKFT